MTTTCPCEEFDRDLGSAFGHCYCGHSYDQHSEDDDPVCTATEVS